MSMSHPEKVKGRKWGGGLKKIGRCLPMYMDQRQPDDEQEPKQHNLLGRKTIAVYRATSAGNEDGRHHRRHSTGSKANSMHIAKDVKELQRGPGYGDVDVFKFSELKVATKHFRPNLILGEGGFGAVYKGVLDASVRPKFKKSLEVAVKQLNRSGHQGDREWLTEVNFLGQLSHPNLVKLIGYCCEGEHRLLVYEYMASGSLERHLFRRRSTTMTWMRRIKVALDAAKGLSYLHGLEHSIIYRDLKAANVLLDASFNAKLSDFGLAKEGPMGDQTHVSTRVMGTYGYAAPEYMMTGRLTAKSDVYSFGVVLMELLIGRRVLEKGKGTSRDRNLVEICRPVLNNSKKLPRILDKRIDGEYSIRAMMRVANLAYQCLSSNPKVRPMMRQVVQILETVHDDEENSRADAENDEKNATKEEDDERKNRLVVEEVMETNKSDSRLGLVRSRSEPEIDQMLDDEQ